MISSINSVLRSLEVEFQANPLKFFNEKDLHFRFIELWHELGFSKKFRMLRVVREFPIKPVQGPHKRSVPHIDIVICNENSKVGLEFYLGRSLKVSNSRLSQIENQKYFVLKSGGLEYCMPNSLQNPLDINSFKEHVDGDVEKLEQVDNGFIVCFFVANHKNSKLDECIEYLTKTIGHKYEIFVAEATV